MQFQTGTFQALKAIADFNFGPLDGITISKGTEMQFDGTILKLGGKDHPCRAFSLAIKAKFVVPVADVTTTYLPKPAQVEVKSATSQGEKREAVQMGSIIEEEQVVGSVSGTKSRRDIASTVQIQQVTQPKVAATRQTLSVEEADEINSQAIHAEMDKPVTKGIIGGTLHSSVDDKFAGKRTVGGGKFGLIVADGASQGVVVASVKSGRNSASVGSANGGATSKAKGTDTTKVSADAVESGTVAQSNTIEGIRGLEAKTGSMQTGIRNTGAQVMSGEGGIVAHPPKPMKTTTVIAEGESILSVGPGGITGDVTEAIGSNGGLAELLPDALVAAPPAQGVGRVAVLRLSPADEISGITAGWDKKRQWKKRVKEAVDFYADWPEALAAIYTVESDAVVKHIKMQLAKQTAVG